MGQLQSICIPLCALFDGKFNAIFVLQFLQSCINYLAKGTQDFLTSLHSICSEILQTVDDSLYITMHAPTLTQFLNENHKLFPITSNVTSSNNKKKLYEKVNTSLNKDAIKFYFVHCFRKKYERTR